MFNIFSKKNKESEVEYIKKIEELNSKIIFLEEYKTRMEQQLLSKNQELEMKNQELQEVKIAKEEDEKNFRIKEKQMEILEKNLRDLYKNNTILKEEKNTLQDSALDAKIPLEKHKYKLPLEKYFALSKFKGILRDLSDIGIEYVNDITPESLLICEKDKAYSEFKTKYEEFFLGELEIESKVHVLKGEKTSKIFSKYRKFNGHLIERSYEHMNDLAEYNFYELIDFGFKSEQIKELIEKTREYFDKNLLKGKDE